MATATTEPGSPQLPIRRNIALLSGAVAANTAMLQLIAAVAAISLDRVLAADGLLGLGLGWNVSFVAATAELSERTEPWERASLLGFNDLVSGATGAGLTLLGGVVLTAAGVAALAVGAAVLVVIPALWILCDGAARRSGSGADRRRRRTPAPAPTSGASLVVGRRREPCSSQATTQG